MIRKVPLVVILGSTGTGKTKLSLELAERFGGEIISADSMQVYSKLDIVTAKATKAEQARAKHHLLDVAKPGEAFTVVNFRDAALSITEDLMSKSKIPIVVGGTNYYIESLLWNMLVVNDSHKANEADLKPTIKITENLLETKMTSEDLHVLLKKVDPTSANRIHPNNRRKIIRALEVYQKSGETLTSIFENQRSEAGGNRLGGPLRYPNTILFWLRCNQDVLNERLEKRVDSMLELGLLPEIRNFYKENLIDSCENKYTKGILQTIGLKEFIPYLEQFNEEDDQKNEAYLKSNNYKISEPNGVKVDGVNDRPKGYDVLISCLDRLKLVTNRYSKKQIKWIKNRFLSYIDRQVPDLYKLDTSDVSQWNSEVYLPAVDVIESIINGVKPKLEPLEKLDHPGKGLNEETTNYCPTCERVFIGEFQWNLHLTSNKHKKRKESQRKKEKAASSIPLPETTKAEGTEENTLKYV
ncbi:tRNA dimethylallyltransferase [Eupeodes corollae]|uniref:tRNA dimethylallyltransferase n=1 Tax=Eupeodes corollae TaxID=290404 RepID=UPI0024901BE7|nr:tRNA dimethylallyltransferase [Eupeodes corollae]